MKNVTARVKIRTARHVKPVTNSLLSAKYKNRVVTPCSIVSQKSPVVNVSSKMSKN